MKKISKCRACNSGKLKRFFDLGKHPLANALSASRNAKEKLYSLSLSWCSSCKLVQLNETIDPKELFSNYVWVTGTAASTRSFAENFCNELLNRFGGQKPNYVLEIASNDGTFLTPFIKKEIKVLGVDPARNIVNTALKRGIATECTFWGRDSARKLIKKYSRPKIIFARNVLPHVADSNDFVLGVAESLDSSGIAAFEVHYGGTILKDLHYDSIYHEHLCYFTLKSLEGLLNRHGLFVFDLLESPISGGSIIVYASPKKHRPGKKLIIYRTNEGREKINNFSSWRDFAARAYSHRSELLNVISDLRGKGHRIVGYGASARSSTLLNFCSIDSKTLPMIADLSPLKQGKFTPGSHIPIVKPSLILNPQPDYILILAWNFADEIRKFFEVELNYHGRYIIPLPNKLHII